VLRRSHDRGAGRPPIDLVSAWASDHQLVLGQLATEPTSNEIPAARALLALLDLRGAVVTLDALHTHPETAQTIRDAGAEYVLALKRNQHEAYAAVETFFTAARAQDWDGIDSDELITEDLDHGRVEQRHYWTTTDPALLDYLATGNVAWPELGCVGMVERIRTSDGHTSRATSYYLTSLAGHVEPFAAAVRGHWGIENSQHWVLDVQFREDESRVRTGHGAENLAVIRRIALNLIRLDRTTKGSVHTKRLRAGWNHEYLRHLLSLSTNPASR
jgi:predicted transposase YbfD/YdcC